MPDMEGLYSLAKQRGMLVDRILHHPHNSYFMKFTSALQLHWALIHNQTRNNLKGLSDKDRRAFHNYLLKSHVFELTSYAVSVMAVEQQLWQLTQQDQYNDAFWSRAFLQPYEYVENPITPQDQEEIGKLLKRQLLESVKDGRRERAHSPMQDVLRQALENDAKSYCQLIIKEASKAVGASEDVIEKLLGIAYQQITNLTTHISLNWAHIVAMYVTCSARLPTQWNAVDMKMASSHPNEELEDYEAFAEEHERLINQQMRFEQENLEALQRADPPEVVIDADGNPGIRINREIVPPSDTMRGTDEEMSFIEVDDFSNQGTFPHADYLEATKQNLREKGLIGQIPQHHQELQDYSSLVENQRAAAAEPPGQQIQINELIKEMQRMRETQEKQREEWLRQQQDMQQQMKMLQQEKDILSSQVQYAREE